MPNHVINRLVIEGATEEVVKVFDFLKADEPDQKGEYPLIDFNKIVPMPKSLDIESSSDGNDGLAYLSGTLSAAKAKDYKKSSHYGKMVKMQQEEPERFEHCLALGRKYLRNAAMFGHTTWYEWRYANWGTKWNAYDVSMEAYNTIIFYTAWDGVPGLIARLGIMFPAVTIKYDYADEDDICYNVGSYVITGSDIDDLSPGDGSPEAWELVFDLGIENRDDYEQMPDGTWEYRDDD